ncbi:sugar phosphate isomerase/epimerase family protein [Rugosimonospora africana]|uniref:Xylose isomerase n=1 Tax=Rugosimonospora africana TaxID=556532 RepID=A0A8J3QYT6_9ACTN|nr:sugar phosphate isomerase/epimerase [Rugosimonospora africana]GIH19383.1 xylose isomerase [Rugosimonospora africana]
MRSPSVQLYSVRDAVDENVDAAIARLAEIGFTQVEPYAFHQNVADLKRALTAAGVTAPSGHAPVIDAEAPEVVFDAAAALGIRTVIDPFIPTDRWQTADDVARVAARANELGALAAERGLEFGYHNHQWEFTNKVDGRTVYDLFVNQLDPAVVLEVDTFWATVGGEDTPALLRRLGDRVRAIHVKDGIVDDDIRDVLPSSESALIVPEALRRAFENQKPAGQGDVDVPAILRAAPRALRVVEFDAYAGDVFAGIAESYAWLATNDTEVSA